MVVVLIPLNSERIALLSTTKISYVLQHVQLDQARLTVYIQNLMQVYVPGIDKSWKQIIREITVKQCQIYPKNICVKDTFCITNEISESRLKPEIGSTSIAKNNRMMRFDINSTWVTIDSLKKHNLSAKRQHRRMTVSLQTRYCH